MKFFSLLFLIPAVIFTQVTTTEFGNISTDIGLDLSYIKRELSMPYKSNRINIAGNKYFFKEPSNATLVLIEEETPVNVITNYNLLEQTFDVFDGSETLKLLPNKIKKYFQSNRSNHQLSPPKMLFILIVVISQFPKIRLLFAERLLQIKSKLIS